MKYEDELFIISYNECDKNYINKMISIIKERMPKILDFFNIKYDSKIVIKLYDDISKYKENLEPSLKRDGRVYQEWMIANTEDGNINMQSLELVKRLDDFKDLSLEEFLLNSCHEFTHLCQQRINSSSPGWFWEVIATTLGNPECQHETKEEITLVDLEKNFDTIDGYGAAYKIGKYLFNNYDKEYILSLVKDNNKLYEEIPKLLKEIN